MTAGSRAVLEACDVYKAYGRHQVLNGADLETTGALKNFGSKIGAAYQIYDDCLDIAGNESEIGKTLGTDLRKGKMTLPILMLLRSAPAEDRERYCELILSEKAGAIETASAVASNHPNRKFPSRKIVIHPPAQSLAELWVNGSGFASTGGQDATAQVSRQSRVAIHSAE